MYSAVLLSILLLYECCPLALAMGSGQSIPNPNQERLGMPQNRAPLPAGNQTNPQTARSKYLHAEALRDAEELCTRAQNLRDQLKSAGEYVVPVSAITDAQKIEKLAHKLRGQLKD